jgi:predicted phage terminase large subunit-like protein
VLKTTNATKPSVKRNAPALTEEQRVLRAGVEHPLHSMRLLVKNNLFFFIQYFWDTYSDEPFVPNWHIEKITQELETVARRVAERKPKHHDLIINVPPGTTKTATVSIFFPVWCWVNWYWMKFMTTSHSDTLALESAEYSRDIIRSEKFRAMFPEIDIKQDKDTKSNFRVVKKEFFTAGRVPRIHTGGGRISTSVTARIIGFHAHIIIPDDIIDPKRALSETGLKDANAYLDHTLSTRKVDKEVTAMVMIMQRLHQEDPTGHILEKKKKIRHICLPGEIRTFKDNVKPQEWIKYYSEDGLLDARRLSWSSLIELESDLGQYGYSGQVGQTPTPPGGGMFKVNQLQIIDALPSPPNFITTVRYWDKAGTQDAGAFTAGVKMSRLANGKFLISDVTKGQWGTEVREGKIKSTAENDRLVKDAFKQEPHIYLEQEPGSGGKESAENSIKNLAGFTVFADKPTGDKIYRADPFSVQVNNGNVLLLRGDWNKAFIEELEYFPTGTYKDQVDAASGAFAKLVKKKQARAIR